MHFGEHAMIFIEAAEAMNCIAAWLLAAERGLIGLDRSAILKEAAKIRKYISSPIIAHSKERREEGLRTIDEFQLAIQSNAELVKLKELLGLLADALGFDASGIQNS